MVTSVKNKVFNYWMDVASIADEECNESASPVTHALDNSVFNIWDMNCPLSWKKRIWENYADYVTATHISSHTSQIRFQHHIVLTYYKTYSSLTVPLIVGHTRKFMNDFLMSCGKNSDGKKKISYMCVIEADHDSEDFHIHILTSNTSQFSLAEIKQMVNSNWKVDRASKSKRGFTDCIKLRDEKHSKSTVWYLHKTFGEEMSFERFSVQRLPKIAYSSQDLPK